MLKEHLELEYWSNLSNEDRTSVCWVRVTQEKTPQTGIWFNRCWLARTKQSQKQTKTGPMAQNEAMNHHGTHGNLILNTTCHELRPPEKEWTPSLNISKAGIPFNISPLRHTLTSYHPLNGHYPETVINTFLPLLVFCFYSTFYHPVWMSLAMWLSLVWKNHLLAIYSV